MDDRATSPRLPQPLTCAIILLTDAHTRHLQIIVHRTRSCFNHGNLSHAPFGLTFINNIVFLFQCHVTSGLDTRFFQHLASLNEDGRLALKTIRVSMLKKVRLETSIVRCCVHLSDNNC
jgi:hypothetical protein